MAEADVEAARQPRADALRNRDRVLRAAEEAFAEQGADVPLDEVARRAGVGAGTVYRHFASKNALLEAVIVHRVKRMAADTRALTMSDDPAAAFFSFFAGMVERVAFNKALVAALDGRTPFSSAAISSLRHEFRQAVAGLLSRAQQAGAVRGDVDAADVITLATGCITMEAGRGSTGRMTALVYDALRPASAAQLPAVAGEPEWAAVSVGRNETLAAVRNETYEGFCPVCGSPLLATATGRPRKYCSDACRQKAHRLRAR